jgi:hypothetical protein
MDYPDVLELLGRTPRELGAVHLHVEPVSLTADGRASATLWLQAAFSGAIRGTLDVTGIDDHGESAIDASESKHDLPDLVGGRVVRWVLPLTIHGQPGELLFRVEAPVPRGAERVRPPWKLFDTIEQPRPAVTAGSIDFEGGGLLKAAMHAATGNLVGTMASVLRSVQYSPQISGTPGAVHKARELPVGFVAPVVASIEAAAADQQVVWAPGQPLPEPPPVALPIAPRAPEARAAWWRCRSCGEEAETGRAEALGMCPGCGASID